jgi:hypothetical protein
MVQPKPNSVKLFSKLANEKLKKTTPQAKQNWKR